MGLRSMKWDEWIGKTSSHTTSMASYADRSSRAGQPLPTVSRRQSTSHQGEGGKMLQNRTRGDGRCD
jgi:hypothetical protein